MTLRILVCDDHRLFGDSLGRVLEERGHEVVGVVADPGSAVRVAGQEQPDVCAMDLVFPNGSGRLGVEGIARSSPRTAVVIVSGTADVRLIDDALGAGAAGYVTKGDRLDAVIAALEQAARGDLEVGRPLRPADPQQAPGSSELAGLTAREREVLQCLVDGLGTAEIAGVLDVARSTARTHIQSLLTKLGVHSRVAAVSLAIRQGLVAPPDDDPDGVRR